MDKSRKLLLEQIMRSIGEFHRCFATSRDSFLAQFQLSRSQMELLIALKHRSSTTGELADKFSVTSSAITQMVDQLETKKLVTRYRDQADKRVTCIRLAPEAKKYFEAVRNQFIEHLGQRFESISNQELETLQTILKKTINTVEKDTKWKK